MFNIAEANGKKLLAAGLALAMICAIPLTGCQGQQKPDVPGNANENVQRHEDNAENSNANRQTPAKQDVAEGAYTFISEYGQKIGIPLTEEEKKLDLTPHPFEGRSSSYAYSMTATSNSTSPSSSSQGGGTLGWGTEVLGKTNASAAADSQSFSIAEEVEGYADTAPSTMMADVDEILPVEPYGERYASVAESGFVSTADNATSTVSADVDTASYANIRRMVGEMEEYGGYRRSYSSYIPEDAVRIEEMLNYFDYDYPAPSGDDKFSITSELSACPWNPQHQLMTLGFAAAEEDSSASEGTNIVFLVDVSGSMSSPDSLPLFQRAFHEVAGSFAERDRISLVTYASSEQVVLNGACGASSEELTSAIDSLEADGATNGEAGLKKAYALAKTNFIHGGVNRIIMVSDGDLNVGMSDPESLKSYVSEQRDLNVFLSVLGFGTGNYNDENMEAIADNGNGNYHYIDSVDEIKRVFSENLTKNLIPFANDVKVQVKFNPEKVSQYRLIGYDNRRMANEDFTDETKDAGDTGPGAQFTVAYEIVPADGNEVAQGNYNGNGGDELANVAMRYKPISGSEWNGETAEQTCSVAASSATDKPSDRWKFQASVIETGMMLRNSENKGTSSYVDALGLLSQTDLDAQRAEFKHIVEVLAGTEQ